MLDSKAFRATDDRPYDQLGPQARLQTLHRQARHDDPRERVSRDYAVNPPPEPSSPVRRFATRWLPESLLRPRMDPGRAGVRAIVVVSLLVLLGVVVLALTSGPSAEPAPPPLALPPPPVEATAPTSAPAKLVVSVVGQVHRPGLVTVPDGARVADAVTAAGGALPETDLTMLNLARRLTDGEQLYVAVPVPPQMQQSVPGAAVGPGGPSGAPGGDGKLDLNSATVEQLDALPGIGSVTAQHIVQWRDQHGRFASVDQLGEVGGIGDVRLSRLRDLVRT